MKQLLMILFIILILYIADLVICTFYCKAKKKKDRVRLERIGQEVQERVQKESAEGDRQNGLAWKIKQLLNGWMLYSVARLGRVPCQTYRKWILKHVYQMNIEKNVVIYGDCWFRAPWNIVIGKGSIVGDGCKLDGRNGLIIGENVNLSTAVYIYTEQHDVNDPYFESGNSGGKVEIGNRAWLSSRTTVLPKVHVGEGAVLASGALASKDLEAFGIYAGIPAKKIGQRSRDLRYEFDGSALPFY